MTSIQSRGGMIRAFLLATLAFSLFSLAAALEEPLDVTKLTLTERTTLDLLAGPARTAVLPAPDGEHFVWTGSEDGERVICLYTIAGVSSGCAPVPKDIDNHSLRWAPDSSGVVFAQDALRMFLDSDIWLFDAVALNVRNLTDDGETSVNFFSEEIDDVPVDILPMWGADSQRIYFLRYSFVEEKRTRPELYAYDLASDALELVHNFTLSDPFSVYVMTISAQGDQLAYVVDRRNEAPQLRILNLETKEDRLLATVARQARLISAIGYLEFSPDGRYLLAHDAGPLLVFSLNAETPAVRIFDMNGAEIPVDTERFAAIGGWLPEGAGLVYLTWEIDPEQGAIFVLPEPGQPAHQLLEERYSGTTSNQESLYWGANQTLLLTGRGGEPLHVLRFGLPE